MIPGSCLCGKIQYELSGEPVNAVLCFCNNCRKTTGSLGMANSWYTKENFKFTKGAAEIRTYEDHATDSGATVERSFCPNCGSPLVAMNAKYPDLVIVTYGTMELGEGQTWKPGMEFFCKRRIEWLGTPAETKKFHEL